MCGELYLLILLTHHGCLAASATFFDGSALSGSDLRLPVSSSGGIWSARAANRSIQLLQASEERTLGTTLMVQREVFHSADNALACVLQPAST